MKKILSFIVLILVFFFAFFILTPKVEAKCCGYTQCLTGVGKCVDIYGNECPEGQAGCTCTITEVPYDNPCQESGTACGDWCQAGDKDVGNTCYSATACACICTSWSNYGCGWGSCTQYAYLQVRTCTPAGCDKETQCIADPACFPTPTPTPIQTHRTCSGTSCIWVIGSGASTCSSNADCSHSECSGSSCVTVTGAGANTCSIPSDCQVSSHKECRSGQCKSVSGPGKNLCTSDPECATTHNECSGGNCVTISGAGTSTCTIPADCTSATHNVCNVSQQCVPVAGAGANECTSSGDCGGPVEPTPTPTPTPIGGRAWFQTTGGDVHTQGDLSVSIPSTATNPNFSLELNNYPGIVSHQSLGEAYFGEGYPSNTQVGHWLAESKYEGKPYSSFEFFKKKYAMKMTTDNFDGSLPAQDGIYYSNGSETLNSNQGDWDLSGNRWLVILVEGDVNIPFNVIVEPGSFLAIASSGNITFGSNVRKAQGVFVANRTINTGSTDRDFAGQGIFAASQFSLSRDFADTRNETTPVETFIARPDFVMSSYKDADNNLWWFYQKWQELAP